MKINWRQKLASRKFWALVAALATSITVLVGADENVTVKITGLITTVGAVIAYILAEAHIDAHSTGDIKDSELSAINGGDDHEQT